MKVRGTPLTIAGQQVEVTHEVVDLSDVQLSPDNPRIRFQLRFDGATTPTEKDLLDLLRDQPGYDLLQKAIRKTGGLHDPIIIRHDGMVVEGNSRLTAFKTLREGNKGDGRWKKIPVQRLPKSVTPAMIAQLMAGYHVAGKTGWRPYAQADQIYELRTVHKVPIAQIADELRMTEREVEYYLDAYKYLVHEVLPHVPAGKGRDILESKWSHALEFVKSTKLGDLRTDPETRKDVAKLIVDGKIKGKEVRDLHKVLKVGKAKTALKASGFKAAKKVLGQTDPVAASKALTKMQAYAEELGKLKQDDVTLLKTSDAARDVLIALHEAVLAVAAVAGVKLKAKHV